MRILAYGSPEHIQILSDNLHGEVLPLDIDRIEHICATLKGLDKSESTLILNAGEVILHGNTTIQGYQGEFEWMGLDILFGASAKFIYHDEALRYYFWKYYPRDANNIYHYLDSRGVIGNAGKLVQLFDDISQRYGNTLTYHDALTRWHVEYRLKVWESSLKLGLDHGQDLFGSLDGRISSFKFPMLSWMQADLFDRAETTKLGTSNLLKFQSKPWDFTFSKRRSFSYNGKLKSTPSILLAAGGKDKMEQIQRVLYNTPVKKPIKVWLIGFKCYLQSLGRFFLAFLINRGETRLFRIFRYTRNQNPEWEKTMANFLGYLKEKKGFTFAHFNDGELTFIKKYLANDHKETWFGRRQQKYNKDLGERLTNALRLKRDRYHVGVPCSTSHPKLRNIANELVGSSEGVVPAMTLHHNLRYFPNIIGEMKNRECFFVMNAHQKLDILERLGVDVKDDNKIIVPFKNSYLLFDELKKRQFPEGAIVILICGMLAKIIIPEWFERNPNTTFIALGSAMDDFIQRTNTKFRLYPKQGLPLTCNIQPTKFFAFGWKNTCKECWNMAEKAD